MRWDRILSNRAYIVKMGIIYVSVHAILVFLTEIVSNYVYEWRDASTIPNSIASLLFAINDILLCAGVGAIQAICFARLGAKIDAPIWRCRTDVEALKRFFLLWFGVNIAIVTISNLVGTFYEYGYSELSDFLALLSIFTSFIYMPLTICWMHSGEKAVEDEEIFRAFRPITRQIGESIGIWLVIGISIFASLYIFSLDIFAQQNFSTALLKTVLIVPFSAVDILVFCWVWNLCIEYRNSGLDNEYDLDEF